MTLHFGTHIIPAEFPELRRLAWNRDPTRPIAAGEDFSLYERNWRFVDRDGLTARETQLIKELGEEFGGGVEQHLAPLLKPDRRHRRFIPGAAKFFAIILILNVYFYRHLPKLLSARKNSVPDGIKQAPDRSSV
jgi:hypothetical protein